MICSDEHDRHGASNHWQHYCDCGKYPAPSGNLGALAQQRAKKIPPKEVTNDSSEVVKLLTEIRDLLKAAGGTPW